MACKEEGQQTRVAPSPGTQTPTDVRHSTVAPRLCQHSLSPIKSMPSPLPRDITEFTPSPAEQGVAPTETHLAYYPLLSVTLPPVKTQISPPFCYLPGQSSLLTPLCPQTYSFSHQTLVESLRVRCCARSWDRMIDKTWFLPLYTLAPSISTSLPFYKYHL